LEENNKEGNERKEGKTKLEEKKNIIIIVII